MKKYNYLGYRLQTRRADSYKRKGEKRSSRDGEIMEHKKQRNLKRVGKKDVEKLIWMVIWSWKKRKKDRKYLG